MFKKSDYPFKSCNKMPFEIDLERLRAEFEQDVKPKFASYQSSNVKRVGWERYILYAHPSYLSEVEEANPIGFEDLTYVNEIISTYMKDSTLVNAMFAVMPPQASIGLHIDGKSKNPELTKKIEATIRFHIPVYTNENMLIFIGEKFYQMKAGECWMFNNNHYHGVLNTDEKLSRNHLIIDVIPSQELIDLLLSMEDPKGFSDTKNLKLLLDRSAQKKVEEFKGSLPFLKRVKMAMA